MDNVRYNLIISKMILFLVTAIVISPFIILFGNKLDFMVGVSNALRRYIDELYEKGLIDDDEKLELEREIL